MQKTGIVELRSRRYRSGIGVAIKQGLDALSLKPSRSELLPSNSASNEIIGRSWRNI